MARNWTLGRRQATRAARQHPEYTSPPPRVLVATAIIIMWDIRQQGLTQILQRQQLVLGISSVMGFWTSKFTINIVTMVTVTKWMTGKVMMTYAMEVSVVAMIIMVK